jgi:ABC-2 type transport system permease protein
MAREPDLEGGSAVNRRMLSAFIRKELVQTLRDPRMRIFLFVVPVLQMVVVGLALHNEVRNVRLAVYAAPSDTLALEIGRRAAGSGWFILKDSVAADPFEALGSGQVDAVLVAPPGGLTQGSQRGGGRLQLLVDGGNTVRAQGVVQYLDLIRRDVIRDRLSRGRGGRPSLRLATRVLYNPTLETKYFMVPGVLGMVLIIVTLLLTASSVTREKEGGTFETLLATPIGPSAILAGKALPYFLLGLLDLPLLLGASYFVFGLPIRGPFWQLFIAASAFIGATVSAGILVSTVARNQAQALIGCFCALFPAILLSGILSPLENIPAWLGWITYFNPLRYFAVLMRNILLKGGAPGLFWPNVGALALLSVILMAWARIKFSRTLN